MTGFYKSFRWNTVATSITAICLLTFALSRPSSAQISFSVTINDPGSLFTAFYSDIEANLIAAGNDWASQLISTTPSTIDIEVSFADIPTANGGSATTSFVGNVNGIDVFEQGAAAEIKTGIDPNDVSSDILINIGNDYVANELWFDPDPVTRTVPVPIDRTDAYSVFLHELGHGLVFNGFRDWTTTELPGDYASTFDQFVTLSSGIPIFEGTNAMSIYGGSVPLTAGNLYHVGNNSPDPGSDLIPDLMNGVVFFRGTRYNISRLDLAIAEDSGLPTLAFAPIAAPEPGTVVLMLSLMCPGMIVHIKRRRPAVR